MVWAATAVGAGTLGLGIYNAVSGGSGGGGSGGGTIGSLNPAGSVLNSLFGTVPHVNSDGSIGYMPFDWTSATGTGLGGGLFGPNFKGNLQDWIYNPPAFGQRDDISNILATVPGALANTQNLFDQSIMPAAQQLVNTGFRTDIQPVRDYAQRMFTREDLPTIAEQFAGQTGTFGTDFLQAGQQAAADMDYQLAALQAQYDESANQRRAAGIPVLGNLATTQLGLPYEVANNLFDVNNKLYAVDQSQQAGARQLNLFTQLAQLGSPSQMGPIGSGYYPDQSTNLLSGLANMAPGFGQAIGDIYKQYTQGANAADTVSNFGNFSDYYNPDNFNYNPGASSSGFGNLSDYFDVSGFNLGGG